MVREKSKWQSVDLTLRPARSLLAEGGLDRLERLLHEVLPRWSRKLWVRDDETSRSGIDVSKAGSLREAIRRHMQSEGADEEEAAEFCQPSDIHHDVATLTGEYRGFRVFLILHDWVFSPEPGGTGQHFGNSITIGVERDAVEELPAPAWISKACATFCEQMEMLHGFAACEGEYESKNMDTSMGYEAIGLDVSRYLPGLYWLNIFGQPYVNLIGKEPLLATPGAAVRKCGTQIMVQFGDDPRAWKTQEYRAAVGRALGHLGRQYFFDREAPRRKTVAPPFRFEFDAVAAEREHKALWARIETILKRDRLSYDKLRRRQGVLTPRAIEALMRLCDATDPAQRLNICDLFDTHAVPKGQRAAVARWLIKLFEAERSAHDQIGLRLYDLAVPEIADDLIRLIQDERFGYRRWPLALALARTKDPRAADAIAPLLGQGSNTRGAIEALGMLRATRYADKIRRFLHDPDSDVRREAKKTLKKLGAPVETPPPPSHLVKNRRSIPKGLEEWSANLDMDELRPTLKTLARCIDRGFGTQEIAEVSGVVDEMKPDQTRAFRFPITAHGRECELWLAIFMDDIDSPDLAVYADPAIVTRFGARAANQ